MISDNKKRVMITLSKNMAADYQMLADEMGVSVSQLCTVILGQYLATFKRGLNALEKGFNNSFSDGFESSLIINQNSALFNSKNSIGKGENIERG